jgi:ABC-type glycerol-3-phosphate transport system permease component
MSLFPKVGRSQPGLRTAWILLAAFLWLGVLLHLFPFFYMIMLSITPAAETLSPTPVLIPKEPTLAAWKLVYTIATKDLLAGYDQQAVALLKYPFSVYFKNSLFMTFTTLLLSLPITGLAAYANSKLMRGRSARWTFLFFIGTMMIPGVVTLIPSFLLTRNFPFPLPVAPKIPGTETSFPYLRLWDTPWAVIIPGVFNAFNFLMFKGFFDTIPDSIIQAARVDGGSEFNIFRKIVLPMSVPVFAVCAWLQFSSIWESYLWPLVTIQSPEKQPVTVVIARLVQEFTRSNATNAQAASAMANNPQLRKIMEAGLSWNGLMVLGLLQTFPIFLMFIICREYLMKGIRIRGFK